MLNRVKNILGIEGVKIEIEAPYDFPLSDRTLNFKLGIHTKSSQVIESVEIRLIEKYQRGWGSSKLIDEYELYQKLETVDVSITLEEKFSLPLSISFDYQKSSIERMGDNLLLRPFSKLALLVKKAKSSFRLEVTAKIKGVSINPLAVHQFIKAS